MNKTQLGAVTLALPLTIIGCAANPFVTLPDDYGHRVESSRVREVHRLDLTQDQEAMDDDTDTLANETLARTSVLLENDGYSLSIEQARALALENNLDLRVALINPTIAQTSVSEEEAAFEAVLSADLRQTETDQPTSVSTVGSQIENTRFTSGVTIPTRTGGSVNVNFLSARTETNNPFSTLNPAADADVGVSITQPLLRNAGRRSTTHALRVASLNSEIEQTRTKLEVIRQLSSVDRAYWLLYAAQQELDVRQQQYELAMSQLERAQRRVDAGADSEIEVIRAEEGVAQRLEAIINAQENVLTQQRELKRIVNTPDMPMESRTAIRPASDPDPVVYQLEEDTLIAAALANRMELLELELQLAIDTSSIDFQRNQSLMKLDLTGQYNRNGLSDVVGDSISNIHDDNFEDWSLALDAELPIGNQAAESRLDRAVISRLQRIATRASRHQTITQEVLDAIVSLEAGWRRVMAAQQSAILAARTLDAEQRQYDVGRRTSTDVLDAATRLADAQSSEIRAIANYQIAQVDLAVATGTLLGATKVRWDPIDPTSTSDAQ
ncbi:MAG: TolC family protein [Planctomycetota bacterium]|jgi:outer membrane protein TolC